MDAATGLVHMVLTRPANMYDVTQASQLLHGQESDVFADAGYRGVGKREGVCIQHPDVQWHVAMMPSKREVPDGLVTGERLVALSWP